MLKTMNNEEFVNHLLNTYKAIDFRYGCLRYLNKPTKDLLRSFKFRFSMIDDLPGYISVYIIPWLHTIVISKSFLYHSPKVLEGALLHEIGHYVVEEFSNPCETKVDQYVVEQGFGEELYEALKMFCYFNDSFIYENPSIKYRLRRIREYMKGV